ncbi:MAG: hypothetical protein GXO74_01025 [Calditrichaeota bacterium]|nr:hypothetical protein [Calditrichota bacterium]
MNKFSIIGTILAAIGAFIFAYPLLNPETVRKGERVNQNEKNAIQQAINRSGKNYFWTDKKLYLAGIITTLLGVVLIIIDLIQNP